MIITNIASQKKHQQRYSIYVDDSYAFSLDELELSASPLRVGLELTSEEVEEWRQRSSSGKAYDAALRYLSYRQRSLRELRTYLQGKDYDDETIRLTLDRLEALKLIDDLTFARAWVADRNQLRPRSRRALTSELMAKGISNDVIDEVLGELSRDDELMALRRLVIRKAPRYADRNKLTAYFASVGYRYDLIKEAISLELDNDET